jgi:hypothetical protein
MDCDRWERWRGGTGLVQDRDSDRSRRTWACNWTGACERRLARTRAANGWKGRHEDLAPDITRQRLLLEGFYEADVDEAPIRGYFDHIASTLGLRTYCEPWAACA